MKVFVTGVGGQLGHDVVNELKKDDRFTNVNFIIDYLGVIVGAHGGPGNICLTYTSNKR